MSRIAFNATSVHGISPIRGSVAVEAEMTEAQMFDALSSFLQHVTDTTWADWQRRLDPDAPPRTEAFASDGSAIA